MWKHIRRLLLLALLALVIIQFISIDKSNPPIVVEQDFLTIHKAPADVESVLRNACYDCHSNSTEYPWYTNIQPVAWWVKGHIKHGRGKLNFSEWATYEKDRKDHKLEECVEEMEERNMPMKSYTWVHPEAKLSRDQINETITWLKSL